MLFKPGQKCLAFHGPLLYEAKVLKTWDPETENLSTISASNAPGNSMQTDGENLPDPDLVEEECYFIHYQGWKATWDEWVGLDRVREFNDENVLLKKSMLKEFKDKKNLKNSLSNKKMTNGRKKTSENHATSDGENEPHHHPPDGVKHEDTRTLSSSSTASTTSSSARVILHIPIRLKSVLVNDWEYVTKDKKISKLPSPITIDEILNNFESQRSKTLESPIQQAQLSEYVSGLKLYFNSTLPILLLYRLERLQFEELLESPEQDFTKIYGCVHLLRLISQLPDLLASTTMDDQSSILILKKTEDLLSWLLMNNDEYKFFDEDSSDLLYVNTTSQYEGVALGM